MKNKQSRERLITVFVILWLIVFHYESTRHFLLEPLLNKALPKVKFLFPPAGWIMFYSVEDVSGNVEVYGFKDNKPQLIDPHDIFSTRTIGFDNIHRGIMGLVTYQENRPMFCRFLNRKFPYFDKFTVLYDFYPSITKEHYKKFQKVLYQCIE